MGKGERHLDRVQAHTSNKMAGKLLEDLRPIFHRLKTLRCPDRHWQSWGSQCAMGDFSADLECSLSLSVSRIQVWVSPALHYQNIQGSLLTPSSLLRKPNPPCQSLHTPSSLCFRAVAHEALLYTNSLPSSLWSPGMTIYPELKSPLSMLFFSSGPWPPPKGFNINTELLLNLQLSKSAKK